MALAGLCWAAALLTGRLNVRWLSVYAVIGLLFWYFTLKSGVHATVAGVLLAFAVPIRADPPKRDATDSVHDRVFEETHSPLHQLEHRLSPYVTYLVLPIFALMNAGVPVGAALRDGVGGIMAGVVVGLMFGKPLGITVFAWLAVRFGWAQLPDGITFAQVAGAGVLAGIGFTMAIFIATLAFGEAGLNQAKLGILLASVTMALIGLAVLSRLLPRTAAEA